MNKRKYHFIYLLCLALMLSLQACKKDKVNFESDNRVLTDNRVSSTVRIINLAGFNQVKVGEDSLTNFIVRDKNGPDYYKYPGTSYFPADGRIGKIWSVPQDLFNAAETASMTLSSRNYQGLNDRDLPFEPKNDYNNPTDYYLMPTLFATGQPDVVGVPRGISAPSRPDHFKIRIVNLAADIKNKGTNVHGQLEDLTGPVSLAYADGSLVDSKTTNISTQIRNSEYIELPYGTYQFKMLMSDGRQMPALGTELSEFGFVDPATSTIPESFSKFSNLTYAPVQTYQPGGIYTIVVAPQSFNYYINEMDESTFTYQNSFQIVTDNSVAVNNTYLKIQGVNAWGSTQLGFRVDGKEIGTGLDFGIAGAYVNLIQGTHKIEALDASGKIIASAEQTLRAAQNYTAWVYADQSGAAKLTLVANDMSGSVYRGASADDATFDRYQRRYFFSKRFLNLSPDQPYITFTTDNGQAISPGINLQPGIPLLTGPYAQDSYAQPAYQVMAYRSKPNVVPGSWASDIEVLKNDAFIASKSLYEKAGRALPVHEPGVYTVALIGQSGANLTVPKAKMIIIKHNK